MCTIFTWWLLVLRAQTCCTSGLLVCATSPLVQCDRALVTAARDGNHTAALSRALYKIFVSQGKLMSLRAKYHPPCFLTNAQKILDQEQEK